MKFCIHQYLRSPENTTLSFPFGGSTWRTVPVVVDLILVLIVAKKTQYWLFGTWFRSMQCFTFFLFRYFSRLLLARSSHIRRSHIPNQTWKKKNSCGCCTIYLSTWKFGGFRKEMPVNFLNYCAKEWRFEIKIKNWKRGDKGYHFSGRRSAIVLMGSVMENISCQWNNTWSILNSETTLRFGQEPSANTWACTTVRWHSSNAIKKQSHHFEQINIAEIEKEIETGLLY
jgi:hypothetical protein